MSVLSENQKDTIESAVIFADLHLSDALPALTEKFCNFVDTVCCDYDAMYLLGDVFDAWVGDDNDSEVATIVTETLARASQDKQVFFMRGNRDFLVRQSYADRCSMTILPDPCRQTIADKSWLLSHGDCLCTTDITYMRYRDNRMAHEQAMLSMSLAERHQLVQKYRQQSEQHQQAVAADGTNILDVSEQAVARLMNGWNATRLVHGHTHRPNQHRYPNDTMRWVVGDWSLQSAQYLSIRHESVELRNFVGLAGD